MPRELAAKLHRAAEAADDAREVRDELIVKALYGGASTREVAAHVGLSHTQVRRIGELAGWPTEEVKRARAEEAAQFQRDQAELERLLDLPPTD